MNEAGENSNHAPGDHDAGHPGAGAPTLDQNGAGNFQQEVAGKEDAGSKPVDLRAEVQVFVHLQRGIAEVDSVQISDDIENEEVGKNAAADTPVCLVG